MNAAGDDWFAAPVAVPARLAGLCVVRHGQSTANAAAARAAAGGRLVADVSQRDADVGLTDTGVEQAAAVGDWLAGQPAPQVVVVSPYRRCQLTARIALERARLSAEPVLLTDERLRDQELGLIEGLTAAGLRHHRPDEHARRERLGRFYYRPPGGESWADVALRLRGLLTDLGQRWPDRRMLWFGHDLTARLGRYLLEGQTEPAVLAAAGVEPVGNASVTSWRRDGDRYRLVHRHDTTHLTASR